MAIGLFGSLESGAGRVEASGSRGPLEIGLRRRLVTESRREAERLRRRKLATLLESDVDNEWGDYHQYYGSLYVGSAAQELTFLLDTGSQWTSVAIESCPDDECLRNHFLS